MSVRVQSLLGEHLRPLDLSLELRVHRVRELGEEPDGLLAVVAKVLLRHFIHELLLQALAVFDEHLDLLHAHLPGCSGLDGVGKQIRPAEVAGEQAQT